MSSPQEIVGRIATEIADQIDNSGAYAYVSGCLAPFVKLIEAAQWYAGEIDNCPCEDTDDGNAWISNKDVPSIPNIIFDQGKRGRAALRELEAQK